MDRQRVFIEAEYIEAITASAEKEADDYERKLQSVVGHRGVRTLFIRSFPDHRGCRLAVSNQPDRSG
jgi:hypothetical protein